MRNFKELKIWQNGIEIAIKTYRVTATFPEEDKYAIVQQMNKAGVSIPSNIAEGSSRKSEKDYSRFIEIALDSTFELETQIVIAEQLKKGNTIITGFKNCLTRRTENAHRISKRT